MRTPDNTMHGSTFESHTPPQITKPEITGGLKLEGDGCDFSVPGDTIKVFRPLPASAIIAVGLGPDRPICNAGC